MPPVDPADSLQWQATRFSKARLQLVIDTLPATTYFNPAGVAVFSLALFIGRAEFGTVPFIAMLMAVALHAIAGFGARLIWKHHRVVEVKDITPLRHELMILQGFIGLCWGAVAWFLWVEGNAANNMFIIALMAMALWAMTLTRSSCRRVYLTGLTGLMLLLTIRLATSSSAAAHVVLAIVPLWVWYMVFTGVAARRRIEEMLQARFDTEDLGIALAAARDEAVQKRQEAEAANHSKTAFLANMSHELRTPLNAIIGFSEIISSQALGTNHPRYPEYAGDIHASGTHLLALINEILDVAKIEAGRMEIDPRPLDVVEVFEAVRRLVDIRMREKNITLRFAIADGVPVLEADDRAFRQILLNLLSNAAKYTPDGGTVEVRCRAGEEGGFELSVEDNGAGIPADKIAALFKPFSQVDNRFDHSHGGTGLGLAVVHGLMRLHGGRAWIESELGRGTKVSVYFPLGTVKRDLMFAAG